MKKEELMNSLSEEAKTKLAACKTLEEAKKVLAEAGVEPLDDELLDAVAGGEMMTLEQMLEYSARAQSQWEAQQQAAAATPAPAEDQSYLQGILKPSERPPHA